MFRRTARIETNWKKDEAASRIAELIGEEASRPFRGHAGEKSFSIDEIKEYRTSFLPRISGRYVTAPGGVNLALSLRPHREVVIFLLVWGVFLLIVSLLITVFSFPARTVRLTILAVPALLGALTYYLSFRVFRNDCRWALQSLSEYLRPDEPSGERHAAS